MNNSPAQAELSIAELLRKLADETSQLVRQEILLARAELQRTATNAISPAADFGLAALFGIGAFGALTALLIGALALAMPLWLSAFVVTVVYGAVAALAAMRGRSKLARFGSPVPQRTIETIKEDITEVRAGVKRGRERGGVL